MARHKQKPRDHNNYLQQCYTVSETQDLSNRNCNINKADILCTEVLRDAGCGDVTSNCADVTSNCVDVTSNCGEVTSNCGDVTSNCGSALCSSDDDSQTHKQSEHSSHSDNQHESVTNIDAPPSYEQLAAPAAHAYSHARLPVVSGKSHSLPVSCSAAALLAKADGDSCCNKNTVDMAHDSVVTSSSQNLAASNLDRLNDLESSVQSHSVPNLAESCDAASASAAMTAPVLRRLAKRLSESDLRLRHKCDTRLFTAGACVASLLCLC